MIYREMRRQDRLLRPEEAGEILKRGEYGVLATVCGDGRPYAVPLSYAYDEASDTIYFHCSTAEGQKLDNIRHDSRACFNVVTDTEVLPEQFATRYRSATAVGTIRIIQDAREKRQGIEAIMLKYSSDFAESGRKYIDAAIDRMHVLALRVEQLTGKGRKA